MKKLRFTLLIGLYALFVFGSILPAAIGSGQTVTESAGCGAGAMGSCAGTGFLTGGEGGAGFDAGYPVDIPVPLAKGFDGVDATTMSFSAGGATSVSAPNLMLAATDSLGTLSGRLVDDDPCVDQRIGVILDGAVVSETFTSNCAFSFSITSSVLTQPIAIVVFEDGATADNGGNASYPVIATVKYDTFISDYTLTVHITNTNGTVNDTTQAEIQKLPISGSPNGYVGFAAEDIAETPFVGVIRAMGGANVQLIELDSLPANIHYGFDDNNSLYVQDSLSDLILGIDTDGDLFFTEVNATPPTSRAYSVSPNGDWVVVNRTVTHPDLSVDTQTLAFINADDDTDESVVTVPDSDLLAVTNISVDWVDDDTLIVLKTFSNSTYRAETYPVTDILDGDTTTVDPDQVFASATRIANPSANRSTSSDFIYECAGSNGYTNLCLSDVTDTFTETLVEEDYDVSSPQFTQDGAYIIFEANYGTEDLNYIAIYVTDTVERDIFYINKGFYPTPLPELDGIFSYLSYDHTGSLQISILNLDNYSLLYTDATLASIVARTPAADATAVLVTTNATATFSQAMNSATLSSNTFYLSNTAGRVDAALAYNSGAVTVTLNPDHDLVLESIYTMTARRSIRDELGIRLAQTYEWDFETTVGAWDADITADTEELGIAAYPQVGVDEEGDGLAVWQQSNGALYNIWYARYDITGQTWDAAALLEADNVGDAINPQIAVNASGDAIAAWQQFDGVVYDLVARVYNGGTDTWGAATVIDPQDVGEAINPTVAIAADGAGIVAWEQSDGVDYQIMANVFDGAAWGGAVQVEDIDVGDSTNPAVGMDDDHNAWVAWQQETGGNYNVYVVGYDGEDDSWSSEIVLDDTASGAATFPDIAVSASGQAVAVWRNNGDVLASTYINYIDTWEEEVVIDEGGGVASNVKVAIDRGGNVVAVWQQSDGVRFNIVSNRYDASDIFDEEWEGAQIIEAENDGSANYPEVAMDSAGNAIVAWQQDNGVDFNTYANRFLAGEGWGDAVILQADDTEGVDEPAVGVGPFGQGIVVWSQENGAIYDIQSNQYEDI